MVSKRALYAIIIHLGRVSSKKRKVCDSPHITQNSKQLQKMHDRKCDIAIYDIVIILLQKQNQHFSL